MQAPKRNRSARHEPVCMPISLTLSLSLCLSLRRANCARVEGTRAFTFMSVSLLLGGLTMPEWKGRVPLTRSHCERITVAPSHKNDHQDEGFGGAARSTHKSRKPKPPEITIQTREAQSAAASAACRRLLREVRKHSAKGLSFFTWRSTRADLCLPHKKR
ncbi:hypothetical protein EVAR_62172_1 [Eumeta japonica]|uniref:Uncharacterized protein n=1 Tax=Eumeta variegata TaxID=151549 RepID=A0A4C1ZTM1_EUMVA|nr:hypothetical protein EVAR_62172_1 [Eumeta japonica]